MFSHKSTVPQWIVDLKELVMLDSNEAGLKLWRMSIDQFRSTAPEDFFHPDGVPRWIQYLKTQAWGESGPWKCIRGDGTIFYCTVRYQLIDHKGKQVGFVFALRAGESLETIASLNNSHRNAESSL